MEKIFFKPEKAWVGDVIPYYDNNKFYIYYLQDERRNGEYGDTTWYEVQTKNFTDFSTEKETISRGSKTENDYYIYTGDIIKDNDKYHMFYTGVNPTAPFCENGKPIQTVMHAVSNDLKEWEKIPETTFTADDDIYELNDWRDPFVFWNSEKEKYYMLLTARLKKGPSRRRGCIALCTSDNLYDWKIEDPFWAPNLYMAHECPDIFKMGDWWYLVYSTFTDRFVTHYRMSKSLEGPWLIPDRDTFDGRGFYAAKTVSNGKNRYVCGWIPTKSNDNDNDEWNWAGNLVIHQIHQTKDGTLDVKIVDSIREVFTEKRKAKYTQKFGKYSIDKEGIELGNFESFSCALVPENSKQFMLTGKVKISEGTRSCGLVLKAKDNMNEGYYLRLEPHRSRLVFDRWPRKEPGEEQWQIGGDVPHAVELERPFQFEYNKVYEIKVIIENTIGIIYFDDKIAMSFRMYNLDYKNWGIFTEEGKAIFSDFYVYEQAKD